MIQCKKCDRMHLLLVGIVTYPNPKIIGIVQYCSKCNKSYTQIVDNEVVNWLIILN